MFIKWSIQGAMLLLQVDFVSYEAILWTARWTRVFCLCSPNCAAGAVSANSAKMLLCSRVMSTCHDERSRERSLECCRERSREHSLERRSRERSLERSRERSLERSRERSLERSRERSLEHSRLMSHPAVRTVRFYAQYEHMETHD